MSMTSTTLATAVLVTDTTIVVTSATNATAGGVVRVDSEWMRISKAYTSGTTLPVLRGQDGTATAPHNILALTLIGLATDQMSIPPGAFVANPPETQDWPVVTYGVTGAIAVPIQNTIAVIDKATAAAMTLAAPAKDADGLTLIITSSTAAAHTVTATGLMNTGTATVNLATFAAFAGASITLVAVQGKWNVVSNTAATLT